MLNVLLAKRSSQCHPARWAYLQNNKWHVVSPPSAPIERGVADVRTRRRTNSPPVKFVRGARWTNTCYSQASLLAQLNFRGVAPLERRTSSRCSPLVLENRLRR